MQQSYEYQDHPNTCTLLVIVDVITIINNSLIDNFLRESRERVESDRQHPADGL